MNPMPLLPLLFSGCSGDPAQIVWATDLASHQAVIDYDYSVLYASRAYLNASSKPISLSRLREIF